MNNYNFRGKECWLDDDGKKVYGKWVYGYLIDADKICPPKIDLTAPDFFDLINFVDPETVGQETTIKDIKLSKIFSGDILGVPNKKYMPWVVEFHDGIFWAVCRDIKVKYNPNSYGLDRQHLKDFVSKPSEYYTDAGIKKEYFIVVGNIHDNAELVEGK